MDLFSEDNRRNPFQMYDHARSSSPVLQVPGYNFWMVFDYDGVKRALTDHEAFSSSMTYAGQGNPQWMIFFDPPRQTKLRGLISRAFTPRMIAGLEPRIRELTRELLDAALENDQTDLAASFSVPLPMKVISGMLGIPADDWERFCAWSDSILKLSYTIAGGEASKAAAEEYYAVNAEMHAYLPEMIESRRGEPREDLLSRLAEAEVDGERLTDEEIIAFCQLLLIAGHETTTNLINNAVVSLLENPGELARLRATPELLPSAIEEVLRYRSPLQWMFRATTREVELGGQTIPAGTVVLPVIGSANRDPKVFADPSRFDITRDPNPHIAFGHGIHFCLGAPLSRMEARIALTELLARTESFELATDGPWQPRKALHVHGPATLPIRFERRQRAVAEPDAAL